MTVGSPLLCSTIVVSLCTHARPRSREKEALLALSTPGMAGPPGMTNSADPGTSFLQSP